MMLPDFRTGTGRPGERGAALAELAMVLPVMLALLLVVFDFGQGFLAYISVTDGARDAARAAIAEDHDCADAGPSTTPQTDLQNIAKNSAAPYAVTVTVEEDTPAAGKCSVTVDYAYSPIIPFVTTSFSLPGIGTIGPLWDGTMSETMVSQ